MATQILMPKLSDTMTEGVILKWLKKEGDKVKQGETIVEIESDKADMELEAYDSGILRKIIVPEKGKASIGTPIAIIGRVDEDISALLGAPPAAPVIRLSGDRAAKPSPSNVTVMSVAQPANTDDRIKASPIAKRLAVENRIELRDVEGSGPQGRVIKRDVEALVLRRAPSSIGSGQIIPGGYRDVELSLIRKTIAKRMQESKRDVPHFTVTIEIAMEAAISFREQINSAREAKISYTDILIKAAALSLMKHPAVNASYRGDVSRQFGEAHIGVAVALDDGLVTPVVRNCEQKSISEINEDLRDLVERARNRKLKPEEYQAGTFTISNLGMFAVEEFEAIINPPEGAILAVGSIVEKPVARQGQIVIGHTMKATLSCDHRIIDGAMAARFAGDFKNLMENPALLLL